MTTTLNDALTVKVRRTWGFSPVARVHGQGKAGRKPKYGKGDRKAWRKDLD
jgi:hypothetical protein